jgi:hypothetical protein
MCVTKPAVILYISKSTDGEIVRLLRAISNKRTLLCCIANRQLSIIPMFQSFSLLNPDVQYNLKQNLTLFFAAKKYICTHE